MNLMRKFIPILGISLLLFLAPLSVQIDTGKDDFSTIESSDVLNQQIQVPLLQVEFNQAQALSRECGSLDWGCRIGNGILWFYEIIFYVTTQAIVVVVALLTDAFIGFSISSNFYRSSGMIEAGWEILRDLTNIILIFALLVSAFRLVLGQNDGKVKKTLMKTILVALVVNFSLFMSYAIIDASNILANVFYNRIDADVSEYEFNAQGTDPDDGGINIASALREYGIGKSPSVAISSQINPQRFISLAGGNVNFGVGLLLITGMAILNILLIWIFVSIILLFLGRILGLFIITILSPLAFASLTILTIPSLQGQRYFGWNHWFSELLRLCFMAPIYLFFLWLVATFLTNEGVLATIGVSGPTGDWLYQILNTYLLLFLTGGLLFMAKKITNDISGDLAKIATKTVGQAIGGTVAAAGLVATGGAAAAGGLARIAPRGSRVNQFGQRLQATNFNFGQSRLGKLTSKATGIDFGERLGALSYARGDTAVRKTANQIRGGVSDFMTGRTPESVKKWQDTVQESRDKLTGRRIENVQNLEVKNATIPVGDIKLGYNATTDTFTTNSTEVNTEDFLREKQADLARMSEADKKAEKDRIRRDTEQLRADLEYEKQQMKGEKDPGKRKSAQHKINNLTKQIEDVENTSTEGVITQIEKKLNKTKNDARATRLTKDQESRANQQDSNLTVSEKQRQKRVDTQASRVTTGDVKSSPKVSGKAEEK